jgi:hypothetical protein
MVPTVIWGAIHLLAGLAETERGALYMTHAVTGACSILLLCGLLELRRRMTGFRAVLVAIGAGFQALAVVQLLAMHLVPALAVWGKIYLTGQFVEMIGVALALTMAAGAWRSVAGPVATIAAVFADPPPVMMRWLADALRNDEARDACCALAVLLYVVAILAVYRRLGTKVQLAPDTARAVRAARRVSLALRLRIGMTGLVFAGLLIAVAFDLDGKVAMIAYFYLALLGNLAITAGIVSGMLGMARANVAGLSARLLCIAAFGALWEMIQFHSATEWGPTGASGETWMFVGSMACLAAGGLAARGYVLRGEDSELPEAMSVRLGLVIGCDVLSLLTFQPKFPPTMFLLASESAAMFALGLMFARLAGRLKLSWVSSAF